MSKLKAFTIDKNGKKQELDTESLVIEIADKKCLKLDLNPHSKHAGGLPVSILSPPPHKGRQVHSIFNIKPGASNVVHLHIENLEVPDR